MNADDRSSNRSRTPSLGPLFRAALLCSCLGLGAASGYMACGRRDGSDSVLQVQQKIPLEAYFSEPSFSEIENTKSRLRALCLEFLTDIRARHDLSASETGLTRFRRNPSYAVDPEGAIQELCAGIAQFKGTEPEMILVQELLCLLKKQQLGSRWLDVYLAALARHPTDPLIMKFAQDAQTISKAQQREGELNEAFELLQRLRPDRSQPGQTLATAQQARKTANGSFETLKTTLQ